ILAERGTRLTVADLNTPLANRVSQELKCKSVDPSHIFSVEADVFCPCAAGQVLTRETVAKLNVSIVAGCANNQLAEPGIDQMLQQKRILYAPDFVINAGGLMSATREMGIEDEATMLARVDNIGNHL